MRKLALLIVLVTIVPLACPDTSSAQLLRRFRPRRPLAPQAAPPASKSFVSPITGQTHTITHTGEFFESKEPAARGVAATADDDDFHPSSAPQRMVAKLSVTTAKLETFDNIDDLRTSLPADAVMQKHKPPITKATDFDRVAEEKRNVSVKAYIYAISREGDNDFHVIIGGDPKDPERLYMNAEVSGLPPADSPFRAPLQKAREQFKKFFGASLPGPGFHEVKAPIPIQITGSLFYDISHPPDAPGPKAHKPHTSWEIHPVTDIQFLSK
jgi:hypothetical protein